MNILRENMRRFKTKNLNEQEIDYSIHPDTGKPINLPARHDDGQIGYENLQPGDIIEGRLSDHTLVELKVTSDYAKNNPRVVDMSWYWVKVISIQNLDKEEIIKVGDKMTIAWYNGTPLSPGIFNTGTRMAGKKYGAYKSPKYNDPPDFRIVQLDDIKITK